MPKRAVPTSRIAVLLDARSPVPLYNQLYERLRRGILSGQLERGMRLPSTRLLGVRASRCVRWPTTSRLLATFPCVKPSPPISVLHEASAVRPNR